MAVVRTSKKGAGADLEFFRHRIMGLDRKVPVLDGSLKRYVNLNDAASTPCLEPVILKINQFLEWHFGIHLGWGFNSPPSPAHVSQCSFIKMSAPSPAVHPGSEPDII